ncbi:MAG: HEAT repeat domain-containing protein [Cyanobacteria bacterium P01_A01_bin.114]
MDLPQIESFLDSPNPQSRMRAITELRHHESAVVVPLLKRRMYDQQFLVRSFVAMGLGHKRNDEAFEALLSIIERETDPNVVAEAANSLSRFGSRSIPYLKNIFEQNSHWLIRQSIFATFEELEAPEILLNLCRLGLNGDDVTVKLAAIANLGRLKQTAQSSAALEILIDTAADSDGLVRARTARTLQHFGGQKAQAVLAKLQQDPDYRVVRAVLEGLL